MKLMLCNDKNVGANLCVRPPMNEIPIMGEIPIVEKIPIMDVACVKGAHAGAPLQTEIYDL